MRIYDMPIWQLFLVTTVLVVISIEVGYLVGQRVMRRSDHEKEAPVSAIAGTVLALLAFILAFTFGIVSDRYDARKALVREQAITISTAYDRTDFLPEPQRTEAKALFQQYVTLLVSAPNTTSQAELAPIIQQATAIWQQLWDMGVAQVESGYLNTDIGSLYMDSLNSVSDIQAMRIAVSVQARMPSGLWCVLGFLVALGMIAVGYQTAASESRRTAAMVILALSFSVVICLIAALDNPYSGYLPVSQRALQDLNEAISQSATP